MVPISAQLKYNIDAVCEYIVKKIPVPVRCVRNPRTATPNPEVVRRSPQPVDIWECQQHTDLR